MANVKITELTAATALAGTDVLPIVDVGADATKKVSVSDLLRNLPDGTASAPALAFADDQNTGVLSPGDNSLAFATSGTQRLVIDSSGNCGIGTSSPASGRKLHVSGTGTSVQIDSSNTSNLIKFTNSAASVGFIGYQSDNLVFYTNNSEQLRIDSSGRVGIGTSSPSNNLHVYDGSANTLLRVQSGTATARINIVDSAGQAFVSCKGDDLTFDTSSSATERVRIDSSGKVGIGTSSPDEILHVANTGGGASILIETNASSGGNLLFGDNSSNTVGRVQYVHSDNSMRLFTNSSERLRIDSSGRLGIGTTSPGHKLVVSQNNSGGTAAIHLPEDESTILGSNANTNIRMGGNMTVSAGAVLGFNTNGSESARIDSSGNVGIGTSSPRGHLHVHSSGATRFDLTNTATGTGGSDGVTFSIDSGTGGLNINQRESQPIKIYTADTERMRIDSSGRLLVGGSATVNSSGGAYIQLTGGDSENIKTYRIGTGAREHLQFYNGDFNSRSKVGSISTSGSSTAFNTSSDYRLKENVVDLDGGITRVKQLQPRRFNFIADNSRTVDGFIAHEAQTVVPEAVDGTHNEVDADGNPVYQGIDQSKLVPLLTAALQEAIAKIETLETKVAALEAQ